MTVRLMVKNRLNDGVVAVIKHMTVVEKNGVKKKRMKEEKKRRRKKK